MNTNFKDLGLSSNILKSIDYLGYEMPSDIQTKMIPLIMDGEDLIGQAQTGTGKTLAYAASILSKLNVNTNVVKAIILTPTRELALQVSEEFAGLNTKANLDVLAVYGGSNIELQIKELKRGVDVVVGTPGRILDLIKRRVLKLGELEFFVLDEADEMLNMGFMEDIEMIFKNTNQEKQVLMLSATMPPQIKRLAEKYMRKDYKHVIIKAESKTAVTVTQRCYLVNDKTRLEALCRILDFKGGARTIIFCQTKKECDELLIELSNRRYKVEAMHGDIAQSLRIKTLERFKEGRFNILIATDVAARGIHVDNIEMVINYRLPQDFESYIHRIGRTGRANNVGEAISLITSKDTRFLSGIERFANCKINRDELPSGNDIKVLKYEEIMGNILEGKADELAISKVRDLNKGDLIKLSSVLLNELVNLKIGSNLSKSVKVSSKEPKQVLTGTTRVFLTIGQVDGLKNKSFYDLIVKETGIDKSNFNNLQILKTFTFVDVNKGVSDKFINKVKRLKYNGREIRAEISKKRR
ncbi:MAG: DEAD/DEAH box helicase [Bacilli bacterium]|nr:DEAD/DEAH box helicase [Bacilli bacterium]